MTPKEALIVLSSDQLNSELLNEAKDVIAALIERNEVAIQRVATMKFAAESYRSGETDKNLTEKEKQLCQMRADIFAAEAIRFEIILTTGKTV